ncbi:MAG: TetR/AcrR family transcriptional regulator [Prolixibacteraceae bacterium]|nr:TetR/AcrR family transcriptional regulator [Prolixibacteraceae bacterium]
MSALKVDTQEKIIKVAHEVFLEKGLQGARMQEIADRAGINKALLHYYFRSKECLFDAVFENVVKDIIPEFSMQLNPKSNLESIIKSFVVFYNEFFRTNPQFPQFFFHEIWQNPDKLAALIKEQKNIKPADIVENINERLPQFYKSDYLAQHMISNVMGMCLFPHIARPLFQRIFFDNDEKKYDLFLSERTDFLLTILEGIEGQSNDNENSEPDEDF